MPAVIILITTFIIYGCEDLTADDEKLGSFLMKDLGKCFYF